MSETKQMGEEGLFKQLIGFRKQISLLHPLMAYPFSFSLRAVIVLVLNGWQSCVPSPSPAKLLGKEEARGNWLISYFQFNSWLRLPWQINSPCV